MCVYVYMCVCVCMCMCICINTTVCYDYVTVKSALKTIVDCYFESY